MQRFTIPNTCVFLLNLDRSTDRLANFRYHYSDAFTRVPAADAETLRHSPYFKHYPCLTNGTTHTNYKALILSTVWAMRVAVINDCAWTVIFEDDAEPPPDLSYERVIRAGKGADVIYLDKRNRAGWVIPGCCMSGMIYSRRILKRLVLEMDWPFSQRMMHYRKKNCLNDWFVHDTLKQWGVKVFSHPLVRSGRFKTTVSTKTWRKKRAGAVHPRIMRLSKKTIS